MPLEFWSYLAVANLFAFAALGIDKARARAGARRMRERDLLLFALLGGSVGALAGCAAFRHKIRNAQFLAIFLAIAGIQTALLAFLLVRI